MGNGSASVAIRFSPLPFDWVKTALYALLAGLVVYAFWVQPAEHDLTCYSWLVGHWSNISNYSHGPLIPLIASFLLWWNVSAHGSARKDWRPFWRALAMLEIPFQTFVGRTPTRESAEARFFPTPFRRKLKA